MSPSRVRVHIIIVIIVRTTGGGGGGVARVHRHGEGLWKFLIHTVHNSIRRARGDGVHNLRGRANTRLEKSRENPRDGAGEPEWLPYGLRTRRGEITFGSWTSFDRAPGTTRSDYRGSKPACARREASYGVCSSWTGRTVFFFPVDDAADATVAPDIRTIIFPSRTYSQDEILCTRGGP